jgi:protease I
MELRGKRIAILIEDNYKSLEVWYPLLRFREAEAAVIVVGPEVRSYTSTDGISVRVDASAEHVRAQDFDAIVIPSGSVAEMISQHPVLLALIYEAIRQGKMVATIIQPGQPMEAALNEGERDSREFPDKLEEIGKDEELGVAGRVIREGNLIQARLPVDLPTFCRMIIATLCASPQRMGTLMPHD